MTELTNEQVKVEFMRRANVTDHPYSLIAMEPCCDADPQRHLGHGRNPWTLPSVAEMRALVLEGSDDTQ